MSIKLHAVVLIVAILFGEQVAPQIWYVKAAATGPNTGTCWQDAFKELPSAIAAASSGDEIWEAMYRPPFGLSAAGHTGGRSVSFDLVDGVAILGGCVGGENEKNSCISDAKKTSEFGLDRIRLQRRWRCRSR